MNELIIVGIIILLLCLVNVFVMVMGYIFREDNELSTIEKIPALLSVALVSIAVIGFIGIIYAYGHYLEENKVKTPYYIEQPLNQRI